MHPFVLVHQERKLSCRVVGDHGHEDLPYLEGLDVREGVGSSRDMPGVGDKRLKIVIRRQAQPKLPFGALQADQRRFYEILMSAIVTPLFGVRI